LRHEAGPADARVHNRTVATADALFFLRLWTAAHRGERLVAQELEREGVSGKQLALLLLVELHEPATTTELATALGVPFMTASDALERLVRDGVIAQSPNPDDRRSQVYTVTTKGKDRLRAMKAPLRRALRAVERSRGAGIGDLAEAVGELDTALARALES
jgi:DNA-binding MarR family transcriptional regulator